MIDSNISLRLTSFIRLIFTLFVLLTTNIFGFYNVYNDNLIFGANTYDVIVIITFLVGSFLIFFKITPSFYRKKYRRYYLSILFLFLFVIASMPFRGDTGIIDSVRVGRHYLMMMLAVIVYYDTKVNKTLFWFDLFKFIAVIVSLQIFINAFNPQVLHSIFPHLRADTGGHFDFQRNYLTSPTMLFPYFLSIYYFYKYISQKDRTNTVLLIFGFFFLASALQGFRTYFMLLNFVLLLILLPHIKYKSTIRYLIFPTIVLSFIVIIDILLLNNQITGKFVTVTQEFVRDDGHRMNRFERDLIFNIPMFLEKPYTGWGFIFHGSEYGQQLGLDPGGGRVNSLYSVDSGYITLLNQVGIIGVVIILFFFSKILMEIYKLNTSNIYTKVFGLFIVIIIFSLYTHGAFMREFGQIPMAIILGLTALDDLKNNV